MNYSYLKEAYNTESFEKEKRKVKKKRIIEHFENDETEENDQNMEPVKKTPFQRQLETPKPNGNLSISKQNIQPYYDDELEKYLDVKQFNRNVNMNYTPVDNDEEYVISQQFAKNHGYDNEYNNANRYNIPSNFTYHQSNPSLTNTSYFQTNEDDTDTDYNRTKKNQMVYRKNTANTVKTANTVNDMEKPNKSTDNTNDIFYKNFINIGLFIFIGILIIFLCEQITEIAIHIGMKRTIAILEPYLRKKP